MLPKSEYKRVANECKAIVNGRSRFDEFDRIAEVKYMYHLITGHNMTRTCRNAVSSAIDKILNFINLYAD